MLSAKQVVVHGDARLRKSHFAQVASDGTAAYPRAYDKVELPDSVWAVFGNSEPQPYHIKWKVTADQIKSMYTGNKYYVSAEVGSLDKGYYLYSGIKIEILSHRSTQDRLMAYLRAVAQQKCTIEFDIPFDRQQLADYLCVERSALSAEISRLSKLGLIMSRKNHFALRRTV